MGWSWGAQAGDLLGEGWGLEGEGEVGVAGGRLGDCELVRE